MVTIWHQATAGVNRLLGYPPSEIRTTQESTSLLPYEIMEMIIAHITHRVTLEAFSLTCRSWYIVAAPHLHHTLVLVGKKMSYTSGAEKPLFRLHRHPSPLAVREIWVRQEGLNWFVPGGISRHDLCNFSTFTNVQTLKLQYLAISVFMPAIDRYFEHLSPTLRSITLFCPACTPRQLSYFLSLFSNLDDVGISIDLALLPGSDPEPVPFSTPKLRGRLELSVCSQVEVWTNLIASCGGLRFNYMDLYMSDGCAPVLLEACAETLETLRFSATDTSVGK